MIFMCISLFLSMYVYIYIYIYTYIHMYIYIRGDRLCAHLHHDCRPRDERQRGRQRDEASGRKWANNMI